ncbi:MAG: helix-turn-helix domain-containing protein [Chloroflexi bacterium]|nr:helix-turn-helix domain-containing protein [Chloroflexota bacterium]
MTTAEHEYLTIAEAATLLRVSKATIRRSITAGQIPVVRIGPRNIRIRRRDLVPASPSRMPVAAASGSDWARELEARLLRGGLTEDELMACIEEMHTRQAEENEGVPFRDSLELIHEARDERDEHLASL